MKEGSAPNHQLRAAREQKMWTIPEAAEEVGVEPQTYWRWENYVQWPRKYALRRLVAVFGKSIEELGFGRSSTGFIHARSIEDLDGAQWTVLEERGQEMAVLSPQDHSNLYTPLGSGVLVPFSLTTALETELDDWPTWFALKQTQILTIISSWNGRALFCDELQLVVDQEIKMLDEMRPQDDDQTYTLSRRQAIIAIAAFPLVLLSSIQGSASAFMVEELLSRCAAGITACWHLLKGSELSVVDHTISSYLPALVHLVQQPSRYQKTAARLVTQGYRLKGIVALHQNNLKVRESCCQRALHYSEIAEDSSLLVAALISLASTFYYDKDPTKAANIYQKAFLHLDNIPPLQRARLSVELAVVYAQQGQVQEALHFMDLAQKAYPEHPEKDPSYLYAEFSPASMILEEGLTHLALAQHYPDREYGKNAWSIFARIEEPHAKIPVPQRIFFEITNHQAETALVLRDQELFRSYLEKGIQGANALNSKQRRREAIEVYKKAQVVWPHESPIEKLATLLL